MVKKYFSKAFFFSTTVLAVPLHAAQYIEQGESKNDSQETTSRQKSSLASNYTPKENDSSVKLALEKEKKDLEKALKIQEQHYGGTHLHAAITMGNLGIIFKNLGQYEKARECYQQNIKVFTEHYGATHAETKRIKRNLAILDKQKSRCIVM